MSKFAKSKKMDVVSDIKNLMNSKTIKSLVKNVNTTFSSLQPFIEKPSYWNGAKALFAFGKAFSEDVEQWSDSFFDGSEWSAPYAYEFMAVAMSIVSKYPFEIVKVADDNAHIRIVDFEGCKVGWTHNVRSNNYVTPNIYVDTDKLELFREKMREQLWEKYKASSIVISKGPKDLDERCIAFSVDTQFNPLPSDMATRLTKYLKNYVNAGITRSMMLYGPPGTGKSTLARTLINNLQLRSLRIRVEDVSRIHNQTLFEAIKIVRPDAIILDDFDRSRGQESLLEMLEFFQDHVKLIIASANNKNQLDEALLRPGRFDELFLIERMDENVIRHVLGKYQDGYEFVKNWPIAFINEYVIRRQFMTASQAEATMKDLGARVARLENYNDHGAWEDINYVPEVEDESGDGEADDPDDAEGPSDASPDTVKDPVKSIDDLIHEAFPPDELFEKAARTESSTTARLKIENLFRAARKRRTLRNRR